MQWEGPLRRPDAGTAFGGGGCQGLSLVFLGLSLRVGRAPTPVIASGVAAICFPGTGVVEHHRFVLLAYLFAFDGGASYMEIRIPRLRV